MFLDEIRMAFFTVFTNTDDNHIIFFKSIIGISECAGLSCTSWSIVFCWFFILFNRYGYIFWYTFIKKINKTIK